MKAKEQLLRIFHTIYKMKGAYFMDYEIMMNGTVRIGQRAPEFEAQTTMGKVSLNDYKGKWLIFFSHPRRFHTCLYNRNDSIFKSKSVF